MRTRNHSRNYRCRPRRHLKASLPRHRPVSGLRWVAVPILIRLFPAAHALAQDPKLPHAAAASATTGWTLAAWPYAIVAILGAIAVLVIHNRRLKRELRACRRTELKLRQAERAKTELLDSMAENVIYLDSEQRIRWANRNALGGPDLASMTTLGQHCYAAWGDGTAPCPGCPVPETLRKGTPGHHRAIMGADGRSWQVQSYPVMINDNAPRGVVVISRDITDELEKEAELLKTRKLESVGVLAGGIAHDFNNMLTAIMGYISLAELRPAADGDTGSYLRKAAAAADRARQLAARLLTFSQGGHPVRRPVRVAALISKAVANTGDAEDIEIRAEVDPRCGTLWCDEAQIQQAVESVVVNARESMPAGGEVLLDARCTLVHTDTAAPLLPGDYLHISVSDRGVGVPEEIQDKVFDPYFTTKPMGADKGSGLGLAITHSIVHRHQGYVSLAARDGGGTTVNILLPLGSATPLPAETAPTPPPTPASYRQERILVLEDEILVWEVAEKLLSHLGYRVSHAPHGQAAVDQFKAAQTAGDPFGMVVLDLTIKGGLGGRETLEMLRRVDPGVRAFVSSGFSRDPVLTDYERFGFTGVIPKPYTLADIKRALTHQPAPSQNGRMAG